MVGEKDFGQKAETYTIMITEHDVLGGGLPIYHVERTVLEMENALFGGKSHIIYVNGSYKGDEDTELRWLIHDLLCTDPDEMHFPELAERARYFKEDSEGVKAMCKIMEDIKNEGRAEGENRMSRLMSYLLKNGKTEEAVAVTESEALREELYKKYGIA